MYEKWMITRACVIEIARGSNNVRIKEGMDSLAED